jgi:hypothetical protein
LQPILRKNFRKVPDGIENDVNYYKLARGDLYFKSPTVDAINRYYSVKMAIFNGLILGAELSVFINLPFIFITGLHHHYLAMVWLIFWPLILFFILWRSDKKWFRPELEYMNKTIDAYANSLKRD